MLAEDNLLADNARGVFMEGTHRVTLRANVIAGSDAALVMVRLRGRHPHRGRPVRRQHVTPQPGGASGSDAVSSPGTSGLTTPNPISTATAAATAPTDYASVFDHFRGNLTAADLMADGFAGAALAAAEQAFPDPGATPAVRRPRLPRSRVPRGSTACRMPNRRAGDRVAAVLLSAGVSAGAALGADRRSSHAEAGAVIALRAVHQAVRERTWPLTVSRWRSSVGSVVALLGPNGSGKTTSLKAAAGLVQAIGGGRVVLGTPGPTGRRYPRRGTGVLSSSHRRVTFPDGADRAREVADVLTGRCVRPPRGKGVADVLRLSPP